MKPLLSTLNVVAWMIVAVYITFGVLKYGNGPGELWFNILSVPVVLAPIITGVAIFQRSDYWRL